MSVTSDGVSINPSRVKPEPSHLKTLTQRSVHHLGQSVHHLGVVYPTRRRLTVHDTAQHVPQDIKGDILKMLRDLLRYVRSHDSCNLLLLTGYLLDLTDL